MILSLSDHLLREICGDGQRGRCSATGGLVIINWEAVRADYQRAQKEKILPFGNKDYVIEVKQK